MIRGCMCDRSPCTYPSCPHGGKNKRMKAALGIALVFTGLTVGYLVVTGKLPMSASVTNSPPPDTSNKAASKCPGLTGQALHQCLNTVSGIGGGPLNATMPMKPWGKLPATTGGY